MRKNYPTTAYLRERLDYDPDTGLLIWLNRPRHHFVAKNVWKTWNARYANKQAGSGYPLNRYRYIGIGGATYAAHRLAFILMGEPVPDQVDHIDHDGTNNRWTNLRSAGYVANSRNKSMPSSNTSGFVGVYWDKQSSKWMAKIYVSRKQINLGRFTIKADAIAARKAANVKYDFHPNHGGR